MTVDQVQPLIERINAIAVRVYPAELGGSHALASPNVNTEPIVRPAGDVHVGNLDPRGGVSPRWSQLRNEVEGDGFTTVDCSCGVYQPGRCFVATAQSS